MSTLPTAPGCSPAQECSFSPPCLSRWCSLSIILSSFICLFQPCRSHKNLPAFSSISLLVWHLSESPWALAQKDSLHFGLSTRTKLFAINVLWGWNIKNHSASSSLILAVDLDFIVTVYPASQKWNSIHGCLLSLWVGPALAGELQSIPALPQGWILLCPIIIFISLKSTFILHPWQM